MSFWSKLSKSIFGSNSMGGGRDGGLYYYVRVYHVPGRTSPQDEIVEIRIHSHNELSLQEDGNYFVRKTVVGNKNFRRAELTLTFSARRKVIDHEVSGGEMVTAEEYDAYIEGENAE